MNPDAAALALPGDRGRLPVGFGQRQVSGSGDCRQDEIRRSPLPTSLDYKLIASRIQQHLGSTKPGMIAFQRPEETMRSFYELATSPTTRRRLEEAGRRATRRCGR